MSKGSNRRCYYFDSNGDPIDGGCPRPAYSCDFYHPEEEGWDTARKTFPKKWASNKTRRPSTPPRHELRRDSGYSRHRRSCSRSRSRSPRPRHTRHDSIASTVPDRAGSPGNSRTSLDPRPTSLVDMGPSTAAGSSGHVPSANHRPTPLPMSIPSLPRAMRSISPRRRSIRAAPLAPPAPLKDSMTMPPPPKDSVPMPPPQPLPIVPPALSAGLAPSTINESTPEQKRAIWEERTRILSESELAREQLTGLEEQHIFALKIVESQYFANLPEEDKTRLKGQLAELEKKRDEAKKLHEESVDKLFRTGSWPVAPPGAVEEGMEENHKEVVKYIQELKDTALQMSKILGDISMLKSPPVPPLFLSNDSDDEVAAAAAAMDVDQPDGKNRKRRRVSENPDGRGSSASSSMPTQEELNEFLERLVHMEGLISTLENDINEHGREAREEFEQLVDTKLEEFQAAREEEEKQRLEEGQQHMQELQQDITLTGEQVGELASEIGDLIMRVGKLEVDVGASRKGRQESFEKVLEVERRLQEYISTRDANVRVIQTFEKALDAYTSQPPSPPATPLNTLPPFDYIFQSLEEPMIQSVRSHLVPVIEDLRKDVENMVHTQNAELYSTLWNKITVTLKVLEMIQSRINQGDIEPGQCLAENVMRP